nr:alpha/beta hydrolase [Actinomyces vulturis]
MPVTLKPRVEPDILGGSWMCRTLPVEDSPAAPGARHACLVYEREAAHQPPRYRDAVLYIHGRNDYFFQTHVAQACQDEGYEFYGLDLRACGRAGRTYERPHDVRDLRVHDDEIAQALEIIRSEHGHERIILMGHSTGGLQCVIWAADHPGQCEGIILNSPWLDVHASAFMRSYGSAIMEIIAKYQPEKILSDDDDPTYAHSLHKNWDGEWDFDLELKPCPSVPVRAGFLAGIRRLQRDVHHGLGISEPILLCCSDTTGPAHPTMKQAQSSDIVLSVEQMLERSRFLGDDVTIHQVPGGMHDLALSAQPARDDYLQTVTTWLREHR